MKILRNFRLTKADPEGYNSPFITNGEYFILVVLVVFVIDLGFR